MYNPNEETQIIGYSLTADATLIDKLVIEDELTQLNKRLELKNRYNELLIENSLIKRRISLLEKNRDEAIEYIENHSLYEEIYDYDYEEETYLSEINDENAKNDLLDILKRGKK